MLLCSERGKKDKSICALEKGSVCAAVLALLSEWGLSLTAVSVFQVECGRKGLCSGFSNGHPSPQADVSTLIALADPARLCVRQMFVRPQHCSAFTLH